MAAEQPGVIHRQAGADYLAAVQKLGLDPECLFLAEGEIVGHPVLVLVTRQLDRAGPLSLSWRLFRAYNASATPREISPFVLRLQSPEQEIIRELSKVVERDIRVEFKADDPSAPTPAWSDVFEISGGGLKFQVGWIYKWQVPKKRRSIVDLSRQWNRFSANVERLAA